MKRILVWDIPTRLFHTLLAVSFLSAFAIANVVDDDSSLFTIHMLLGGTMVFMILLRIVWGFVGSRWSRFTSFALKPAALVEYLRGVVTGSGERYVGHNPATSMAALAIFGLIFGLAATGALMSQGEIFEELHEVLAWTTLAVVGTHVAGIVLHTLRHRENIAMSMVHGHKSGPESQATPSGRPVAALVFVALTGVWSAGLVRGYDAQASQVTLPLIGTTIHVGEDHSGETGGHTEHDDDD